MTAYEKRNIGVHDCGKASYAQYTTGCRCFMCKVACSEYNYQRKYGPRNASAMVSASSTRKARKRVQEWLDHGYSLRQIIKATGVPRSSMRTLMTGKHHSARCFKDGTPQKSHKMMRTNYERIMNCKKIVEADRSYVDASNYYRVIDELLASGLKKVEIARATGTPVQTIYGPRRKLVTFKRYKQLALAAPMLKKMADERRRQNDVGAKA